MIPNMLGALYPVYSEVLPTCHVGGVMINPIFADEVGAQRVLSLA